MGSVLIDNWDLNSYSSGGIRTIVDKVDRPIAPIEDSFENYNNNDGAVLEGVFYRNPELEIGFWIIGGTPETRRNFLRSTIVPKTSGKAGHKIQFHDDGVRYYQAVRTGSLTTAEYIDSMYVLMKFKSLHPWMFGETRTFNITSTAQAISFSGNTVTPISGNGTITASGSQVTISTTLNPSTISWDATSGTQYSITFDSEKRTCNQVLRYNTSWLYANPASSTIRVQNASSVSLTVTLTDRWL